MILNDFFVEEALDIAGGLWIAPDHAAVLLMAAVQKFIFKQDAVLIGIEKSFTLTVADGLGGDFETAAVADQTAQTDYTGSGHHDEHDGKKGQIEQERFLLHVTADIGNKDADAHRNGCCKHRNSSSDVQKNTPLSNVVGFIIKNYFSCVKRF